MLQATRFGVSSLTSVSKHGEATAMGTERTGEAIDQAGGDLGRSSKLRGRSKVRLADYRHRHLQHLYRPEETMSPTKTDVHHRSASYNANAPLFLCPITGYPCEGDLSYLCEDYGCPRKRGLSPCSQENLQMKVSIGIQM